MNPAGEPSATVDQVAAPVSGMASLGATLRDMLPRPIRDRLHPASVASRLACATLWSAGGTCVSRGLGLVTFIIVARILGKAIFGEWAILRVTVAGFQIFAGFGMGATVTKYIAQYRAADPARAGRILGLTAMAVLATSAAAAVVLATAAPWIAAKGLGAPHLARALRLCSPLLFLSGVHAWQLGALTGFEAFKAASKVELATGVASTLLTLLGALWAGLDGAIWGMLASAVLRCLLTQAALRDSGRRAGVTITLHRSLTELSLIWSFSVPELLAAAAVAPTLWLVQALLVNQPDGYNAMAEFAAAHQWRMALSTLPTLLCAGYLPVVATLCTSEPERARRVMIVVGATCGGVTALAILPIALLSKSILAAYGTSFESAASVLLVLLVVALIDSINSAVFNALLAAGRMWQRLGSNMCWAAVLISSSWLVLPHHGALGLALTMLIAQALHLMIQFAIATRALRRPPENIKRTAADDASASHLAMAECLREGCK